MDAISHGASDGMKISINVIAMLIGVIALIALLDALLGYFGHFLSWTGLSLNALGLNVDNLRLKDVVGAFFSLFAVVMGVPPSESLHVGSLMGTKMVINEFVAYSDLTPMIHQGLLSAKSVVIASFALCGFANFSSIAIQLGGIGVSGTRPESRSCETGVQGNALRYYGILYFCFTGGHPVINSFLTAPFGKLRVSKHGKL